MMIRRPPNLLVTLPSRLYLYVTAERSRATLAQVDTIIVDEIHALARDKRGSLTLSLERLHAATVRQPVRIGLSATVKPVETAARLLVGAGRRSAVVDSGHRRRLDLLLELPDGELEAAIPAAQFDEIVDRIAGVTKHRTTLVFVNTKAVERVAHQLGERLGPDQVAAHHGSLSRERAGSAWSGGYEPAICARWWPPPRWSSASTSGRSSWCARSAPHSIATFLQRVGRASHQRAGVPGRVPHHAGRAGRVRVALLAAVGRGRLDALHPPEQPLDILAQQIVAEAAAGDDGVGEDELFDLVTRAWPYRRLARRVRGGRRAGLGRHRDRRGRRMACTRPGRRAPPRGRGARPPSPPAERSQDRRLPGADGARRRVRGHRERGLRHRVAAGRRVPAGYTHPWQIVGYRAASCACATPPADTPRSRSGWGRRRAARTSCPRRCRGCELRYRTGSTPAAGRRPSSWCVTGPASTSCRRPRRRLPGRGPGRAGALLPSHDDIVFERFFDAAGGMQLIVHLLGAGVNRALGLGLRKKFCLTFDFELQAAASDDAVLLSLGPQHSFPLEDVPAFLRSTGVQAAVSQAVLRSPMFTARWRWNLNRSLAVLLRRKGGRLNPFNIQRMEADDLMAAVFPSLAACQDNAPAGPIEIPDHRSCARR